MSLGVAPARTFSVNEVDLTPEEFRAALAEETRRRLGISAEEMLARFDRGELPDAERVQDLLIAARLLIEPTAA